MSIMNEYTYQHMKKNKKNTISTFVAVVIASALLCALCVFVYSYWQSKIESTIDTVGNWQGEIWEDISGEQLSTVMENPEVDTVMAKGDWITTKLPDTKRPYFLLRNANKAYWNDMNMKNTLMEGHFPEHAGEIVVSKLFFSDNPSYKLGDKISGNVGYRVADGEKMGAQDYVCDNESFESTGADEYTIVGTLDVAGASAYPGYIAMGYLDDADTTSNNSLTVYLRFAHPSKIYDTLPEIAESIGMEKNSRGEYGIVYNTVLLELYGIKDASTGSTQGVVFIVGGAILMLLVMGTFALIIYNAFTISSNSRIKELSILKSLGATPKQIKHSVLYEGFLIWLIQSPISILFGYLFTYLVLFKVNGILEKMDGYNRTHLFFSWIVILIALICSLVTVLFSAWIPAHKMAKISAVEGIQENTTYDKKKKHVILSKCFGIVGLLAGKQFSANKRSFRTSILSLALCFTLISSYLSIVSIYNLAMNGDDTNKYDMNVQMDILDEPDPDMVNNIISLPETKEAVVYRQARTAFWTKDSQASDEFKKEGAFSGIDKGRYGISEKDNSYMITVNLIGLEKEDFEDYCKEVGTDPKMYESSTAPMGILFDNTYLKSKETDEIAQMPMLNWNAGDVMHLSEQVDESKANDGDYEFEVKTGAIARVKPGSVEMKYYMAGMILPMEQYRKVTSQFARDRELEVKQMYIDLLVGDENSVAAKEKLEQICSSNLGKENYSIWSLHEEKQQEELKQDATQFAVYAIAIMVGLIGLFHAFSTIISQLQAHRKDYALLRSVGLTPAGINKILILEGASFAISPVLLSIPFIFVVNQFMLSRVAIRWSKYLPVAPIGIACIYALAIAAAIFVAYACSSQKIKHGKIIEDLKSDNN